jgi:hypothetical protein
MTILPDLVDIYQCNYCKMLPNKKYKSIKTSTYFNNQFDFIKEKFLFFVSYKITTHDIQRRIT